MYEAQVAMRSGAMQPVFGQVTAASGTLTITNTPSVTLYRSDGTSVFAGTQATGWNTGALVNPMVWFNLDTASLPVGVYNLVFAFAATGTADGLARNYRSDVQVSVLPNVEIVAATYDPTTPLGQVRFHCADTDIANALFSDAELTYCLMLTNAVPEMAAAKALRAAAADNAKIAMATRIGNLGTNTTEVYKALLALALALEASSPVVMVVSSPDAIFTMATDNGATPGTMDDW